MKPKKLKFATPNIPSGPPTISSKGKLPHYVTPNVTSPLNESKSKI